MITFKTHSGTDYNISMDYKFWGGCIKEPVAIASADINVEMRAFITLKDGRLVNTSPVQEIRSTIGGQMLDYFHI